MIQYIFDAVVLVLMWLLLGQLKLIASDTAKKDELNAALEKFGALVLGAQEKKKMVAFRAAVKKEEDDI